MNIWLDATLLSQYSINASGDPDDTDTGGGGPVFIPSTLAEENVRHLYMHVFFVCSKTLHIQKCHDSLWLVCNSAGQGRIAVLDAKKEGCRSCEWRYWCSGGCPLLTYRLTGRNDIKSPNCAIYKALFPEALRLEAFRLLKYEEPITV